MSNFFFQTLILSYLIIFKTLKIEYESILSINKNKFLPFWAVTSIKTILTFLFFFFIKYLIVHILNMTGSFFSLFYNIFINLQIFFTLFCIYQFLKPNNYTFSKVNDLALLNSLYLQQEIELFFFKKVIIGFFQIFFNIMVSAIFVFLIFMFNDIFYTKKGNFVINYIFLFCENNVIHKFIITSLLISSSTFSIAKYLEFLNLI